MGKIRVATLGSEEEQEQRRRAQARRQTKKAKKQKVEGVGLKGGERIAVIEGADIKPEVKKLVEEVESGRAPDKGKRGRRKGKGGKQRSAAYREASRLVDRAKLYPIAEAVALVKKTSLTRFDGTLELHVNLNAQTLPDQKGDYRGSVVLPHGTGKEVRVAIADEALVARVEAGTIDFDVLVAHPSLMPRLAKVAKILGPRGLMPNPKNGTVTENPEKRAKELAQGQVHFKTEPGNPIIHLAVGKVSFEDAKLIENIEAVIAAIGRSKIARATLSATMGPGVKLAVA